MKKIKQKKIKCSKWFKSLRNTICREIETLEESKSKFKRKKWLRDPKGSERMGGGEMSILRGNTFEKAGVNISTVFGKISKNLKGKILVLRILIILGIGNFCSYSSFFTKNPCSSQYTHIITKNSWFGGGMDITPTDLKSKESENLANIFIKILKNL